MPRVRNANRLPRVDDEDSTARRHARLKRLYSPTPPFLSGSAKLRSRSLRILELDGARGAARPIVWSVSQIYQVSKSNSSLIIAFSLQIHILIYYHQHIVIKIISFPVSIDASVPSLLSPCLCTCLTRRLDAVENSITKKACVGTSLS